MAPLIEDGTPNLSAVREAVNAIEDAFADLRPRSAVLWESPEAPVEQVPGSVMVDAIVDMARFALTIEQSIAQPMVVVTKRGPRGTRVVTASGNVAGPGDPSADFALPNMIFGFTFPAGDGTEHPDDDPPGKSWGAQDFATNEGPLLGAVNAEIGNLFQGNRQRFVRAYVARNGVEYTAEEWDAIRAADYRVKCQIVGPVQQIAEWAFPVPAAAGALVCNQIVDLRDYGMVLGYNDCKFVASFERDGRIIRGYPGVPGAREWITYTGEAFDPPTYPIEMDFRPFYPGYEHELLNAARAEWFRYGAPAVSGGGSVLTTGDDAWGSVAFGACTRDLHTSMIMRAWRTADDGAADYVPAEGQAAIPVPAGAKDGCVLRVRLFRPHRLHQGYYPWFRNSELADAANVALMRLRTQRLEDRMDAVEAWIAAHP